MEEEQPNGEANGTADGSNGERRLKKYAQNAQRYARTAYQQGKHAAGFCCKTACRYWSAWWALDTSRKFELFFTLVVACSTGWYAYVSTQQLSALLTQTEISKTSAEAARMSAMAAAVQAKENRRLLRLTDQQVRLAEVEAKPRLDLRLISADPPEPIGGEPTTLHLRITNTGKRPALDIIVLPMAFARFRELVGPPPPGGWPIVISGTQRLSTLNAGESHDFDATIRPVPDDLIKYLSLREHPSLNIGVELMISHIDPIHAPKTPREYDERCIAFAPADIPIFGVRRGFSVTYPGSCSSYTGRRISHDRGMVRDDEYQRRE